LPTLVSSTLPFAISAAAAKCSAIAEGKEVTSSELVLVLDDISAHEARRNLEVLVNDRVRLQFALDGKALAHDSHSLVKPKGGPQAVVPVFRSSNADAASTSATSRQLTVRPETTIEIDVGSAIALTSHTVALMPRRRRDRIGQPPAAPSDIVTALTVARTLISPAAASNFSRL